MGIELHRKCFFKNTITIFIKSLHSHERLNVSVVKCEGRFDDARFAVRTFGHRHYLVGVFGKVDQFDGSGSN